MRIDFGLTWPSVCVARTCSTSLVPMPKARAPNAPWVAVCESPQTIVMPGWVTPSSGPMTWPIPCRSGPRAETGPASAPRRAGRRRGDVGGPLPGGAERVARAAELRAVALERLDLHAAELVADERGGG